jgi:uncharacterized protein
MPVTTTYPGVYIEELPSQVRTITGVATSIAAFIGWAPQGSTTAPKLVLSFSDYTRQFGGLDTRSLLGYSVYQFFQNGGQQAYIVRVVSSDSHTASLALGSLTISANSPGDWVNSYSIGIKIPSGGASRFRLQFLYTPTGSTTPTVVESFESLSLSTPDPLGRYVVDVINNQSNYLTAAVAGTTEPSGGTTAFTTGKAGTVLAPSTSTTAGGSFETAAVAAVGLLDLVDLFNLLCVPGEITTTTLSTLEQYCEGRMAFLIADSDPGITDYTKLASGSGLSGANSAFYFPWVNAPDPLRLNAIQPFPPCGFVAGIYASTDASRGVWKAPAGTDTALVGVSGLTVTLSDAQNGVLNPVAVNCLRTFAVYGSVVWGARTTQGADEVGSQWKYVPVRRLALYLEDTLYRALKWVVFEPNDEPLWSQIRLNVGAFMQTLFRQGAFQGSTPQQAYFVKCDSETTTSTDQNNGVVNIVVGFAPLKPAEFVVIQIQQMAGQSAS